jgi:hypothetical protein
MALATRIRGLGAGLAMALVASIGHAGSAAAAGQSTFLTLNLGGNLVPGDATVPQFHMDFLLDDVVRLSGAPVGSTRDLEISLTSPNTGVFRFLFSPREQFGVGSDPLSGANRAYAGLTWNLFDRDSIYGNLGLAGSFDPTLGGYNTDPLRRTVLAPLMFHGAVELGYRIDQKNSLSLSLDQGVAAISRGAGPESIDNVSLRYGLKF